MMFFSRGTTVLIGPMADIF